MPEYFYVIKIEDKDYERSEERSGTVDRDTPEEAYDFVSRNDNPCLVNNSNATVIVKEFTKL